MVLNQQHGARPTLWVFFSIYGVAHNASSLKQYRIRLNKLNLDPMFNQIALI